MHEMQQISHDTKWAQALLCGLQKLNQAKPNPEGIEKLLSNWGGKPEEAVMIGDDINDVLAGNAAGCSSVYIQREHPLSNPSAADILCVDLRSLITTMPIGVKGKP